MIKLAPNSAHNWIIHRFPISANFGIKSDGEAPANKSNLKYKREYLKFTVNYIDFSTVAPGYDIL
jgi:hypothetical protein